MTTTPTSLVQNLGPLDWRVAIVDGKGRPTPEFQRRWQIQLANNQLIGFVAIGNGPPTTIPKSNGEAFVDVKSIPWTFYVSDNNAWHTVGVINFLDLKDAPHTYGGSADKLVQVNVGANGLVFASISDVLDLIGDTQGDILYRDASSWMVLAPGTSGQVLSTNGAGANPSWITPSSGPSGTHGFGFSIPGKPPANTVIGYGSWPSNITFASTGPIEMIAEVAATASTVFTIEVLISGTWTSIGTLTFAASGTSATLSITGSPVTITAGQLLRIVTPVTQDSTLANVGGMVNGTY